MRLVILSLLLLSYITTSAQSFVVRVIGNDCSKCKVFFEELLTKAEAPIFLIFPNSYLQDAGIIEETYGIYPKANIVYSDIFFNKFNLSTTSVGYLNSKNEIIHEKSIIDVDASFIESVNKLYDADILYTYDKGYSYYLENGWMKKVNNSFSTTTYDSLGVKSVRIVLSKQEKDSIIQFLNTIDSGFYHLTDVGLKNGKLNPQFVQISILESKKFESYI